MDLEEIGKFGIIVLLIGIWCAFIIAFMLVAGFLATYIGVTGIIWWAVAIVIFLLLLGILGMINRVGQK